MFELIKMDDKKRLELIKKLLKLANEEIENNKKNNITDSWILGYQLAYQEILNNWYTTRLL